MTDHKELIAEGHRLGLFDDEATDYGDQYRRLIHRLTVALTDALAAAQPRQIDREALIRDIQVPIEWQGNAPVGYLLDEEDAAMVADAILALPPTVEGEVEYRASIGEVVFGESRTTPETAIDAAWSAYADHSFPVDDENFRVYSRTVTPWIEVTP